MDRNDQQSGPPRQRPTDWGDGAAADPRATSPGERAIGHPGVPDSLSGQPLQPGPYPDQPRPGNYPPEHAPFARSPYGDPSGPPYGQYPADPPWSGGPNPGYPPPGQPPWQRQPPGPGQPYPPQQGRPYPSQQGQPYPSQQGQPYPPGQVPPGYGPGNRRPAPGFSAGPPVPPTIGRRKKGSILPALIFGLLAIVLAGVAAYLYVQENDTSGPVAPTAAPAQNQFIQVQNALQDAGLTATTERQNATSPEAFPTREPGQAIRIDGHDAWIYIFPGVEAQQAATDAYGSLEPRPLVTTASGTALTTGPPTIFSNSNVIILLSMDDDPGEDVTDKVEEAVESLP